MNWGLFALIDDDPHFRGFIDPPGEPCSVINNRILSGRHGEYQNSGLILNHHIISNRNQPCTTTRCTEGTGTWADCLLSLIFLQWCLLLQIDERLCHICCACVFCLSVSAVWVLPKFSYTHTFSHSRKKWHSFRWLGDVSVLCSSTLGQRGTLCLCISCFGSVSYCNLVTEPDRPQASLRFSIHRLSVGQTSEDQRWYTWVCESIVIYIYICIMLLQATQISNTRSESPIRNCSFSLPASPPPLYCSSVIWPMSTSLSLSTVPSVLSLMFLYKVFENYYLYIIMWVW